jgi:CRISPR-associated protein Csx14
MTEQVLIATLGSEPQVVTLALDLLEQAGQVISEVIVLHTAGKAMRAAMARLREEFA